MDTQLLYTIITLTIFCVLFLIKNNQVYRAHMNAIQLVSSRAKEILMTDDYKDWQKCYDLGHSYGTYNRMMLDLTKWTFNQMYPKLEERLKEI